MRIYTFVFLFLSIAVSSLAASGNCPSDLPPQLVNIAKQEYAQKVIRSKPGKIKECWMYDDKIVAIGKAGLFKEYSITLDMRRQGLAVTDDIDVIEGNKSLIAVIKKRVKN